MTGEPAFTTEDRQKNYVETRQDARVALMGWLAAALWTVGVSWWLGQERPAPLLFGVPRWVVVGVMFPWVATLLFNTWYSAVYLTRGSRTAQGQASQAGHGPKAGGA